MYRERKIPAHDGPDREPEKLPCPGGRRGRGAFRQRPDLPGGVGKNVDKEGQIAPVYSISADLDYPGIGPEHAWLHSTGRAQYVPVTDNEAVDAFEYLSRIEGIIPAIESAHAVAHARKIVPKMNKDDIVIICLSGRGDKDVKAMAKYRGRKINE